ncbi:DUF4871 domain-containing protein [Sporosarcina sp. ACRSL]|uniref:DUF4871 domain-containing protein n=1 Tax=Sporosarcina sp. ACRSL TaxID=2918215 RepID=UPI001EF55756|nr:DUF4871 domain-containing protein [Sporosarcina sp. ACRSL]MCG7346451.1 DUF4871 domain-containing protein [Sporosarcina sp. ACRSL]
MKKWFVFVSFLFLFTLFGCEAMEGKTEKKETWEVSSIFKLPVTFGDGTEGEYLLIGEEGKVGFLVGSGEKGEAEAEPIIANQANKYMWHFWGDEDDLSGDFKVIGVNEEGEDHPVLLRGDKIVWEYLGSTVSPHNGADSHIPSNMVFPSSGLWKLMIYFDEELFGEIVISVEEI